MLINDPTYGNEKQIAADLPLRLYHSLVDLSFYVRHWVHPRPVIESAALAVSTRTGEAFWRSGRPMLRLTVPIESGQVYTARMLRPLQNEPWMRPRHSPLHHYTIEKGSMM